MRLITRFELARRSDNELSALFRLVSEGLARTAKGSPERRNALASLENIRCEQAMRLLGPRL
jgi:hypothetical protein